jgi:two-component system sensor histidine kinase/response regulator
LPLNREMVVLLLKRVGFEVDTAENGDVAVAMVFKASPGYYDAVLMDIQMPVMDGYEASRLIRGAETGVSAGSNRRVDQPPIIALTAHAFTSEREKCREAGMVDYITKPIDEDELYRVLMKWIQVK